MSEQTYVAYCAQSGHALFEGTGSQVEEFNALAAGAAVVLGHAPEAAQSGINAGPAQKITL